ncbi:MAG: hypothetical protein BWX92_03293 [Deltaproteobacteria bacterium ADurb.Bin135]|nr:MAG: hypothetical protein BWX92_03293 [Deltaproteobacteria bacterium ADurb.Bin135]
MNKDRQKRQIINFLSHKKVFDVDAFCLYQWIERCHFHKWWDLAVELSAYLPPNSLDKDYDKRLNYILKECRDKSNERAKSTPLVERVGSKIYVRPKSNLPKTNLDLTGTIVHGFCLEGKTYRADSHKDVYMQIIQIAFNKYPEKKEKVFAICGSKRIYFSKDRRELSNRSELISGTHIWAELNFNANTLYNIGKKILKIFGMYDNSFEILTTETFGQANE